MSMSVTSQDDAADVLGCSPREFARWLKKGCPGEPRRYVLRDCIAWARQNIWGDADESLDGVSPDLKDEYTKTRIQKMNRDIKLQDFKIGEQSSQLVDAEEMRSELMEKASTIRSGLEQLERQYGADALDLVLEIFDEALSDRSGSETDY